MNIQRTSPGSRIALFVFTAAALGALGSHLADTAAPRIDLGGEIEPLAAVAFFDARGVRVVVAARDEVRVRLADRVAVHPSFEAALASTMSPTFARAASPPVFVARAAIWS